ncbi:hypothetical protein [Chryseobacterium pennae]|uniref:hypothetical protein n=1 Tax=Chryseobacterium pennae TaxID=2258962 RepID=UPI0021CEA0D0|nr:hypothetical protein [Chryseobacterium pennae]
MELRIKPFPKNIYPKRGLLIKGSSLLIWLQEMENLGINLDQVKCYAIPANNPIYCMDVFLCFMTTPHRRLERIFIFNGWITNFLSPKILRFIQRLIRRNGKG